MKLGKRRYAVMFGLLAVSMAASGCSVATLVPWLGIPMLYASLSFTCMAIVFSAILIFPKRILFRRDSGR